MARQSQNTLDQVAEELAYWIDDLAGQLAEVMSAGGTAPFAAQLTEQQKLDYYTNAFFNADGTPNLQGRAKEMQRLGPENFALTFKAVLKAHPDLAVPAPPEGAAIPASPFPSATPAGPKLPGLPPGLGIPRSGGGLPLGDVGGPAPAAGTGPLG